MNSAQRFTVGLFVALLLLFSLFGILVYPWASCATHTSFNVLLDGVWFTSQTITTTGYGLTVWNRRLKGISLILMIVAIPIWTLLLGLAVNLTDEKLKRS